MIKVKIVSALLLYFFATLIYFYGEAKFLQEAIRDKWAIASLWASLKVISIPMYAMGTYWLFSYGKSWSISEFPYWIMSIVISALIYNNILHTKITWREIVGTILILIAVCLIQVKEKT